MKTYKITKNGFIKTYINGACTGTYFYSKGCESIWIEALYTEFIEETNVKYNDFEIVHDIESMEEIHTGSNGIEYKTVFYPAKYIHPNVSDFMTKNKNKFQKQEVGDVRWLLYEEVLTMFRDYETEKINMIKKMHKQMVKYLYEQIIK